MSAHKHDRKGPEMCAKQPEKARKGILCRMPLRIRGGGLGEVQLNKIN